MPTTKSKTEKEKLLTENLSKMKNNDYPNWLVPLDIAQELKAIGFDEHCLFAFSTEKKIKMRLLPLVLSETP